MGIEDLKLGLWEGYMKPREDSGLFVQKNSRGDVICVGVKTPYSKQPDIVMPPIKKEPTLHELGFPTVDLRTLPHHQEISGCNGLSYFAPPGIEEQIRNFERIYALNYSNHSRISSFETTSKVSGNSGEITSRILLNPPPSLQWISEPYDIGGKLFVEDHTAITGDKMNQMWDNPLHQYNLKFVKSSFCYDLDFTLNLKIIVSRINQRNVSKYLPKGVAKMLYPNG